MLALRHIIFSSSFPPSLSAYEPFRKEKVSTPLQTAQAKVHTKALIPEFKLITRV